MYAINLLMLIVALHVTRYLSLRRVAFPILQLTIPGSLPHPRSIPFQNPGQQPSQKRLPLGSRQHVIYDSSRMFCGYKIKNVGGERGADDSRRSVQFTGGW